MKTPGNAYFSQFYSSINNNEALTFLSVCTWMPSLKAGSLGASQMAQTIVRFDSLSTLSGIQMTEEN